MPSLLKRVAEATSYLITGVRPSNWFGPLQPLQPMAPAEVKGRQFDYVSGQNLQYRPRATELVGFAKLKRLAETCNLLRIVIERQKDLLEAFDWQIQPIEQPTGGKPKASSYATQIKEMTALLREPEPGYDWAQWLRRFLEQVYVYDALTIYPRQTLGGSPYSLDLIDGATIQPLLDLSGRRPQAPSPAYVQVLKGVPAADFSLDELLYFPKNPRVDRLYGYSRVQQIVDMIETQIERAHSQKLYFTAGNMTDGILAAPKDWTTDQIKTFQGYWDDIFEGNLAARRHGWWVPGDTKFSEIKAPPLKDEFDEWMARVICFAFSTSAGPFIKQQNRSNQESQQEVAEEGGIANDMAFIKRVMDKIMRMRGYDGIEFSWSEDREFDPQVAAVIDDMQIKNGSKTINQVKDRLGLDPVEGGDETLLLAGSAWATLDNTVNPPEPPAPVIMHPPGAPMDPGAAAAPGAAQPGAKAPAAQAKPGTDPPKTPPKMKPVKKSAPIALKTTRPGMNKTIVHTQQAIAKVLKATGADVAHQVHRALLTLGKAEGEDDNASTADEVAAGLALDKLDGIADAIEGALSETALEAGKETLVQLGITPSSKLVDQVNLRAVKFAQDRAAELVGKRYNANGDLVDSPNAAMAIDETTRASLRDVIAKGLEDNIGADAIRDTIATSYAFSPERAATITHTEIARANVQGGLAGAREATSFGVKMQKIWLTTNSDNCCDDCQDNADDGPIDLDDDFSSGADGPPEHPNCLPGFVPVEGQFIAATRANYVGPMREIILRSGAKLTITPNHDVLTRQGFVPASEINKGAQLFRNGVDVHGAPTMASDKNEHPATIKEVFSTMRSRGAVSETEPLAADFDGDAQFFDGQIEVVTADSHLRPRRNPPRGQRIDKRALMTANVEPTLFNSDRPCDPSSAWLLSAAQCGVGFGRDDSAFDGVGVLPSKLLRVGVASNIHTGPAKRAVEGGAAGSALAGELLKRLTIDVSLDEVVEVRDFDFAGHVYDLQSAYGWIVAAGVFVSNCQCSLSWVVDTSDDSGEDEEEED